MSDKIKLGCVDFLNAMPLIYPLESGLLPHPFEIVKDVPSFLVEALAKRDLDIALASTAALLELGEGYSSVPGIGICSDGPVLSVALFHKGDVENLKRVHLDPASRTGNLLAKIILNHLFKIEPEFAGPATHSLSPSELNDNEGLVLIGDKALTLSLESHDRIDLGTAWNEMTGLPFVYAVWIGRDEYINDKTRIPLLNSQRIGRSMIGEIISIYPDLPVPDDIAESYLTKHIKYDINEEAEAGLARFLKIAEEYI